MPALAEGSLGGRWALGYADEKLTTSERLPQEHLKGGVHLARKRGGMCSI